MLNRILVVEDNSDIAELVSINLNDRDKRVDRADNGAQGLAMARSGRFDLVILDLTLPSMDGVDVCRTMRRERLFTPVIMLTARTAERDRVRGLEVGADDYLPKPFSVRELVARVNAMLRRRRDYDAASPSALGEAAITAGDLTLHPGRREVYQGEQSIELTAREFELLLYFARRPGRVLTRSDLLDSVWGYGHEGYEHTVNSHINRLRAKIEPDPGRPDHIQTVWGVGYKFSDRVCTG